MSFPIGSGTNGHKIAMVASNDPANSARNRVPQRGFQQAPVVVVHAPAYQHAPARANVTTVQVQQAAQGVPARQTGAVVIPTRSGGAEIRRY